MILMFIVFLILWLIAGLLVVSISTMTVNVIDKMKVSDIIILFIVCLPAIILGGSIMFLSKLIKNK